MNRRSRQVLLGIVVGAGVAVASVLAVGAFGAQPQDASTNIASSFAAIGNQSLPTAPAAIVADFADVHTGIGTPRQVGDNAFIASFQGDVCLVMQPGSSGCTDQLDHGVWLQSYMIRSYDSEQAPFDVHLYGVAEDGVSSLTVALADGSTRAVPVVNNAFQVTLANTTFSQVQGITVDGSAGQSALDPSRYFPTTSAIAGLP